MGRRGRRYGEDDEYEYEEDGYEEEDVEDADGEWDEVDDGTDEDDEYEYEEDGTEKGPAKRRGGRRGTGRGYQAESA